MAEQGEYGGPSFGGQSYGGGGYNPTKSWAENQRQKQEDENLGGWLTGYNPDLVQDPFAAAIREKQKQRARRSGLPLGYLESSPQRNMPNAWDSPGFNPPNNMPNAWDSLGWDVPMLAGTVETPLQEIGLDKEMPWYSPLIGVNVDQLDPSAHTSNPQLDTWGNPINAAYNFGPFDTRYAHDPNTGAITGQPKSHSGLSALKSVKDAVQDFKLGFSIPGYGTPPANPHAGFMDPSQLEASDPSYAPSISLINPTNTTPTVSPLGGALMDIFGIEQDYETPQEDTDALMNDVQAMLGELDLSQTDHDFSPQGILDPSPPVPGSGDLPPTSPWEGIKNLFGYGNPFDGLAQVDDVDAPWGVNPISTISHSGTEREYAERALYSQIANQITQAAGQSSGRQAANAPAARPAERLVGRQAANASAPVRHDPIQTLVRTMLTPKKQMNQIAKHAQESLRQGRTPDMSTLSDYQAELVNAVLSGPSKPIDYSNPENRGI